MCYIHGSIYNVYLKNYLCVYSLVIFGCLFICLFMGYIWVGIHLNILDISYK